MFTKEAVVFYWQYNKRITMGSVYSVPYPFEKYILPDHRKVSIEGGGNNLYLVSPDGLPKRIVVDISGYLDSNPKPLPEGTIIRADTFEVVKSLGSDYPHVYGSVLFACGERFERVNLDVLYDLRSFKNWYFDGGRDQDIHTVQGPLITLKTYTDIFKEEANSGCFRR